MKRLIIATTGATGIIYAERLLSLLKPMPDIETHLIVSKAAEQARHLESALTAQAFYDLADVRYPFQDIAAAPSSGSFRHDGMIIIPCTVSTLGEIAAGISPSLLARAADVTLKERRRLVLVPRETPLHQVHLENMLKITQMGGIIAPAVPAFYQLPETILDIVDHTVGRVLDLFDIQVPSLKRWKSDEPKTASA